MKWVPPGNAGDVMWRRDVMWGISGKTLDKMGLGPHILARGLDPPISAKTLDHPILAKGWTAPSWPGVGPQVLFIYSFAETHPSQGLDTPIHQQKRLDHPTLFARMG